MPRQKTQRIFWIDAICIDQANVDERSKQVACMADVYNEAHTVLVWLGEETLNTQIAFATIVRPECDEDSLSEIASKAIGETFHLGYWEVMGRAGNTPCSANHSPFWLA